MGNVKTDSDFPYGNNKCDEPLQSKQRYIRIEEERSCLHGEQDREGSDPTSSLEQHVRQHDEGPSSGQQEENLRARIVLTFQT